MPGRRRNLWGTGIWALYGAFGLFVLVLAAVASTQRFDLVEDNYYERGLAYQSRLEETARTEDPRQRPFVSINDSSRSVRVCFPAESAFPVTGSAHFFRPSSALSDFRLPFAFDSCSCLEIPDQRLLPGYWKLKCEWQDVQGGHYSETALFIR